MDLNNKYGTLEAQIKLLDLMERFHEFCVSNGVKYSLAYGSLLGAIRHNGFIPWDDDLDVFVDRINYDLLSRKLANSDSLRIEKESMESLWVDRVRYRSDNESAQKFIPTLDILVLDNVPENKLSRHFKMGMIKMLQGMIKNRPTINRGSFLLKVCSVVTYLLGRLFPLKWKKRWYNRVSKIGDNRPSAFVANYNGEYSDLARLYPSDIMDSILEHSFEKFRFCVMAKYDECLTLQYGDYMVPPKEEDRIPRHGAINDKE